MDIKPIETSYKGYKFRSRLEARWAVFFDAMGIKWEYEVEGYDLGEHGYYLPDFWLPTSKVFAEVKPNKSDRTNVPAIYMAGKFTGGSGKNCGKDWRSDFGVDFDFYSRPSDLPELDMRYTRTGYAYCGPYPVDITSGHGAPGHFESYYETSGGTSESDNKKVLSKCLKYIDQCEVLFAWIFSDDCYGTLAEIGYAKAKKKTIVIGVKNDVNVDELWFSLSMADRVVCADSHLEAFDLLLPSSREELLVKALVKGKGASNGLILYGDPLDCKVSTIRDDGCFLRDIPGEFAFSHHVSNYSPDLVKSAAEKARSARFEHGQTPK